MESEYRDCRSFGGWVLLPQPCDTPTKGLLRCRLGTVRALVLVTPTVAQARVSGLNYLHSKSARSISMARSLFLVLSAWSGSLVWEPVRTSQSPACSSRLRHAPFSGLGCASSTMTHHCRRFCRTGIHRLGRSLDSR